MTTSKVKPELVAATATATVPCKRLLVITGDKGGTGKSTFARVLVDILLQQGIKLVAFDSDKRNAQLYRFYNQALASGVARIDLATRGGADALINQLEAAQEVILIDLPAGAGEDFERFEQEMDLIQTAKEMGYRLTVVSVINRVKDCVNSLRTLLDYCGDRVDYVVVKNLFFGTPERFQRFDESKTKTLFLQHQGVVMHLPDLYDGTTDLLDQQNLTFSEAQQHRDLSLVDRTRVKRFLQAAATEMSPAASLLDLSGTATATVSGSNERG